MLEITCNYLISNSLALALNLRVFSNQSDAPHSYHRNVRGWSFSLVILQVSTLVSCVHILTYPLLPHNCRGNPILSLARHAFQILRTEVGDIDIIFNIERSDKHPYQNVSMH